MSPDQQDSACKSSFGEQASVQNRALLPGLLLLLTCDNGLVMVDPLTATALWTRPVDESEVVAPGREHVVIVSTVDHPAEGLHNEFVTRTVTVLDPHAGTVTWTAPLEEWIPEGSRAVTTRPDVTVSEALAASSGTARAITVSVDAVTSFAAADGTELWHSTTLHGSDVGSGVDLDVGASTKWIAYEAKSGKTLWSRDVPDIGSSRGEVVGRQYWSLGDKGILEIDVPTGRVLLNRVFPADWTSVVASRDFVLAFDGKRLSMYRTTDLHTPLWTRAADNAEPQLVSADTLIVQATSGLLVLDGHTGQDVDPPLVISGAGNDLVDGLTLASDNTVVELGNPEPATP